MASASHRNVTFSRHNITEINAIILALNNNHSLSVLNSWINLLCGSLRVYKILYSAAHTHCRRDYEEFEDTKGVIRIRKSKEDRQHNGQEKNGQKDKQRSTKHTHKTKIK